MQNCDFMGCSQCTVEMHGFVTWLMDRVRGKNEFEFGGIRWFSGYLLGQSAISESCCPGLSGNGYLPGNGAHTWASRSVSGLPAYPAHQGMHKAGSLLGKLHLQLIMHTQ